MATKPKMTEMENITNTANEIAESQGYKNAKELINDLNDAMANGNKVRASQAQNSAAAFTRELLRLCLYQDIDSGINLAPYEWTKQFEDQKIEAGNSKEYLKNVITGGTTYNPNTFVPTTATYPKTRAAILSLFTNNTGGNDQQQLSIYGYQFKKELTILANQWVPYFVGGKLGAFIESQINLVRQSIELFKVSQVEKVVTDLIGIVDTNNNNNIITDNGTQTIAEGQNVNKQELVAKGQYNISKRIRGTATNFFDAFANEIFPEIEKMEFLNNEYNIYGGMTDDKPVSTTPKNDLIILLNTKTYTIGKHGVPSKLYNYKLMELENMAANIYKTGKKLNVPTTGGNDQITVTTTDLIPENTVLVMSKNAIKHLSWVDETGEQSFTTNMTIQHTTHVWGALGVLPWEHAFVYTNSNLNNTTASGLNSINIVDQQDTN